MGVTQVKAKSKNKSNQTDLPKITITLQVDISRTIAVPLLQLTNWSFEEIKNSLQIFQRLSEYPMIDSFLFHKMMSYSKKNCDIMFSILSRGQKYVSVYELICLLVLTSFNTFARKFQFLQLVFDFHHNGRISGKQFILLYLSMLYGYCRLTGHELPDYNTADKFVKAFLFPGEQEVDYMNKQITLRRCIEQFEASSKISDLFNRFEHPELHNVQQNYTTFNKSQFRRYSGIQVERIYRIITGLYANNDCVEISLIEENRELRRQIRRDQCQQRLELEKQTLISASSIKLSPIQRRQAKSLAKIETPAPTMSQSQFRSRKLGSNDPRQSLSPSKSPSKKKTVIFLHGKTYSKKQIMESITYFKNLSDSSDTVSMKDFFKKFENKMFLKKQVASIFKYLDAKNKREISITQYFKSLYPGVTADDLSLLHKWYELYQQIYEADSLVRNQVKVAEMSDARTLPPSTLDRIKQIFQAMDNGSKGYLNFEDLRKAYRRGFTIDELQNLLKEYGINNMIYMKGLCKMLLPVGWEIEGVDLENL